MNIKTRYEATRNHAMREIIEVKGFLYRRFEAHGRTSALWQERIHTGEFHNILDPARLDILESGYQMIARDATPDIFVRRTGSWVRANQTERRTP